MQDGTARAPTPLRRILLGIAAVLLGVSSAFIAASPAQAATVSWSGELGPGEATWNRPDCSGAISGMEWWQVRSFSVDTTGSYTLEMAASDGPGGPDGYFLLYENSFDAAQPQVNCIASDDDSGSGFRPQIVSTLQSGVTYFLVTTQCCDGAVPSQAMTYTNEISGPGIITLEGMVSSSLSLVASPNPVTEGSPFDLSAQAAATGTALDFSGSVEFFANGTSLGTATVDPVTGMAELLDVTLPVGTHSITATYTGNSTIAGSNAEPLSVTVNGADDTGGDTEPTRPERIETAAWN